MNTFSDEYIHLKTSLKQLVGQYERVLINKAEKELQTDFISLSCAMVYAMVKQFQRVSTISKFRKVQDEFTCKFYYDLIFVLEMVYKVFKMMNFLRKKLFLCHFIKKNVKLFATATYSIFEEYFASMRSQY